MSKRWVSAVFLMNPKLERMIDTIDRLSLSLALSARSETLGAYNKMLSFCERRVCLINLRVLYGRFCEVLGEEDVELVKQYLRIGSVRVLSEILEISRTTLSRRLSRAFNRCARVLFVLGYTQEVLERDYSADLERVEQMQVDKRRRMKTRRKVVANISLVL